MIVEEKKFGECVCRFDDSAYKDKTEEDVKKTIAAFSAFIAGCMRKEEEAKAKEKTA
ncbi:MAG: hypothetical protein HFH23_09420 [Ruminococcus sp.]|nr:hypothetical protein [Ruminococcus sp.]